MDLVEAPDLFFEVGELYIAKRWIFVYPSIEVMYKVWDKHLRDYDGDLAYLQGRQVHTGAINFTNMIVPRDNVKIIPKGDCFLVTEFMEDRYVPKANTKILHRETVGWLYTSEYNYNPFMEKAG